MSSSSTEVLYVLHPYLSSLETGRGHDVYAYQLLENMKELGVSFDTIDSGYIDTMKDGLFKELFFPLRMAPKKYSVYHATASVNARGPAWVRKRPLVTTIHDVIWFHTGGKFDTSTKDIYKRYCIQLAATKSDRVIVPFRSTYQFVLEQFKIPESRLRLVPYGINHKQFYANPEHAAGKTLDPSKPDLKIVFIGQLTKAKGVDSLIRAFSQVHKKVPNARLQICSGGWHEDYIKGIWNESDVKDFIEFKGHLPSDQLRSAYADADITVFPSRYGFGLPTLESMACATPTIAGRTLDAVDFVTDEALMIDPENIDELAGAMVKLLTDPELYHRLSVAGLSKSKQFSWANTAKQTREIYREFS